jgi:2-oxoisovalerate dehydrogenase E1 component alpha subunit
MDFLSFCQLKSFDLLPMTDMEIPKETMLEMYWRMLIARHFDERAWALLRQEVIGFHLSGIGHEAIQVALAYALERGHDWVVPYYRDLALLLALGLTPREYMLGLLAKKDDPVSGGRQLPHHWSLKRANVVSGSSVVGAQAAHAAGIGLGIKLRGETKVVLTTAGEGATAMGDWYEAVNWAAIHRLPVVFVVENNRYAISSVQGAQMAVANVADKAKGLGLPGVTVNGIDFLAVHRMALEAVSRARRGEGPTLIEATTYRIPPHSSDDDDRAYRTQAEVAEGRKRDPLPFARNYLEKKGLLTPEINAQLEQKAREIVEDAVRFAQGAPDPSPDSGAYPVYAEDRDYA